ncbi:efflux RND transporter periplasmic adaptor subunit [Desulforudis sp. 1088]|uniref:efflux RND transporter periplasmic adaptor subunit n=1 Tax=unclassified Candidatus Desulforudis TaxID=2635950 RepID=UPI003CE54175
MKLSKKVYLGVGVLAAAVVAGLMLSSARTEVETVEARSGGIIRTVEDTGYVQASTDYSLYAAQGGRVIKVAVEAGQPVKQGQTLAVLENLDLAVQANDARTQLANARAAEAGAQAALERTRLELNDAKENLARMSELLAAGAATQAEYEKAQLLVKTYEQGLKEQQARQESAQAQAAALEKVLQDLTTKEQQLAVKSPAAGVVLDVAAKKEQVLVPGSLVATVAVLDRLEVRADILSDDLREVRVGQKVAVSAPALGEKVLQGEVKKIYPRAEEKQSALGIVQRRVPVIISLSETANLKPGYEVNVAIETFRKQNMLIIPREAVRTLEDGRKQVKVVVDGRVRHRLIETGASDRENIEVIDGLRSGDLVVRDGSLDLAEGARVRCRI